MSLFLDDLRQAARSLGRSRATTAAAVASLALGLGANLAVYTAVHAVLDQRPPVDDPARLVALFVTDETPRGAGRTLPFSYPNFEDFRDRAGVFSSLALGTYAPATLVAGDGLPEQLGGLVVTADYFATLGVGAAQGRTFVPEEGTEERPVVVVSHSLWQRRFAADPTLVGRTVRLNRQPFTVVGVAPPGFRGTMVLIDPDFWVPMGVRRIFLTGIRDQLFASRRALMFPICIGRLRPGGGVGEAAAAVAALGRSLAAEHPADNRDRGATLLPLAEAAIPPERRQPLARAAAAVGWLAATLLVLACVTVANLLLVRLGDRQGEVGVRLALGAGRWQLVRRLLVEAMLLAAAGGAAGLLTAFWSRGLLAALRPPMLDRAAVDLHFDGPVFAVAFVLPLAAGLAAGLGPALRAAGRAGAASALGQLTARGAAGRRLPRLGRVLAGVQVAVALLALGGAGVFLDSLAAAERIDLGFQPANLLTLGFDLGAEGYGEGPGERFFDQLGERAAALPGVEAVTLTSALPFFAPPRIRPVAAAGGADDDGGERASIAVVDPGYFRILGIPLLRGRDLAPTDDDGTAPVAVVNQALADRLWPGADPLRGELVFGDRPELRYQVVGMAATHLQGSLGEEPQPIVYLPRRQSYSDFMTLVVKTAGEPAGRADEVRRALQPLDPRLPITNVQPMSAVLDEVLAPPRALARLATVFAVLAATLAAVGVGGVMLTSVRRRRREIAVRMAVGATRPAIGRRVVAEAARLALGGLGAGLILWLAVLRGFARPLGELLYAASPFAWGSLAVAAAALAAVALTASLAAAYRAASLDPVSALREE